MTKKLIATIHGITVNKITDDELEDVMESQGIDSIEEFKRRSEAAARSAIAKTLDDSVELLEVVCDIEEVEETDPEEYLDGIEDGGGCIETTEHMAEERNV